MLRFDPTSENLFKYKRDFKYTISSFHVLNIQAKTMRRTALRRLIYKMKEYYTDYLYMHNLAVHVHQEMQVVECKNKLHSFGLDWKCGDCGGTGKFARNPMYVYHFKIEEVQFVWHQPCSHAITIPAVSLYPVPRLKSYYLDVKESIMQDLLFISWRFLLVAGYENLGFEIHPGDFPENDHRVFGRKKYEAM
jgi:hypothetical protein